VILSFALLLAGHALADGPLQRGWIARCKRSHHAALWAHAALHGLMVGLVLQNPLLGILETMFHAGIDSAKGQGLFGTRYQHWIDQSLHVACKLGWLLISVTL